MCYIGIMDKTDKVKNRGKFAFCLWDYKPEEIEKIPTEVLAQRFIDFWATEEKMYLEGRLDREDFFYILKTIAKNIQKVRFDERVKELVVKELIKEYAENN